jgi:hypothetical protein
MITILKGDMGNIDFGSPIDLTKPEKEKFVKFLKTLFYSVKEEEVSTFRFERLGNKAFSKEWEKEEYEVLLDMEKDNAEASRLLGRSWMSIEMKRMFYIDEMMAYAKKKGINLFKASKIEMKKLIEDYIREHEEELAKRREERVEERREIKQAKEFLENYSQRENEIKFLISIGKVKKESLDILKKEKIGAETKLKEVDKD